MTVYKCKNCGNKYIYKYPKCNECGATDWKTVKEALNHRKDKDGG